MRVYVETNYILELAFLQEQCVSCRSLLLLARGKMVDLVVPAFCIGEPYGTLVARDARRRQIQRQLGVEIRELQRSKTFRTKGDNLERVAKVLTSSVESDRRNLDKTLKEIIRWASIIPLNRQVLQKAIEYQQTLALSPQDSIVYASVWTHAAPQHDKACFMNRDGHFLDPEIQSELESINIRLISSFDDGVDYIKHTIGSPP